MSISTEQKTQFNEQGYTMIPDFWSGREIAAMRAELGRLVAAGHLRNVSTENDGKTHSKTARNLQVCPIWHRSTLFRAVPFVPKVVATISALIGDPFMEHLDQIFLKPAASGAPTNWHQDNAYFKIGDPMMGTAMWTALHDANRENGTLRVIPGSQRDVYEHTRDPGSDHHIRCYPPEENAVDATLPAGGAIFFCYGVAHATGANRSDKDRAGLALHFLRSDFAPDELKADDRDCRPHITGPQASGGEKEYGVTVAGTWEAEVETALTASRS